MSANYILLYSDTFKKLRKRLGAAEQKQLAKKLLLFERDPYYPSLRSKKLEGCPGFFEFSVNMNIRVLWRFEGGRVILLLRVGGHDIIEDFVRNQR